jgi:hypothetical protein
MHIEKLKLYQESPKGNILVSNEEFEDVYLSYQENCSIIGYLNKLTYLKDIKVIKILEVNFETWKWNQEEYFSFAHESDTFSINLSTIQFYCNFNTFNFDGECRINFWSKNIHINSLEINSNCKLITVFLENIESCKITSNIGYIWIGQQINDIIIWGDYIDKLALTAEGEINSIEINLIKNIWSIWMSGGIKKVNNFKLLGSSIKGGGFNDVIFNSFILNDSQIENTKFYNVIFPQEQNKFIIKRSLLSKNNYSGADWWGYLWSEVIYQDWYFNEEKYIKISSKEMKENFRMLKHEHDEIWNKTEANKFFAKEMEYHMKSLKESWNKWDYFIAHLQKFVSNFGQDWLRALTIYFIVCLLYFGFSQIWQGLYNFISWSRPIIQSICTAWKELVQYLNPLPKFDEIQWFWYLLFSLVKWLLVYQIIVALRRISQR